MTTLKHYPTHRYHPEGHLALIFTAEEDAQLSSEWVKSPPEGFECPKQAHFFGTASIPLTLMVGVETLSKEDDLDSIDEDIFPEEESAEQLIPEEPETPQLPKKRATKGYTLP